MIASRGMYIRNTAYIPSNWKDIRNYADMNKLSEIAGNGYRSQKVNRKNY